jgi:ribose transport system ATP-binding protein
LLGENGAGKSTLAKIIAGIYPADAGNIVVDGQAIHPHSVKLARKLGIATVFQELSLAPHLSVLDNLFLGCEEGQHPFAWLHRSWEAQQCRSLLTELELDLPLDLPVSALTIAQKQMLEIAKALLRQPQILIMDEPTSTLTEREKSRLFTRLQTLKQQGVAILYVTHHLQEVLEVGTRVSAMMDGAVNATVDVTSTLTETQLLEMLTGRNLSLAIARPPQPTLPPLFTIEDLQTAAGCAGVNLEVRPGEIVGIYGVMGCGRESLGRAIVGLTRPTQGKMTLLGHPYLPLHPKAARKRGISYLAMDRKEAGILAERPIRENLNLSNLSHFNRWGMLLTQQERLKTLESLDRLQVRYASTEDAMTRLSGGNQQKVLFGRAIAHLPRLLVLEDPTAGIDMGAKLELYRQMQTLAAQGLSFLLLSSDLFETILLCNRVYVMYDGKIVDELWEPTLEDEERILAGILGRRSAVP